MVADWPTRTGNVELKCGDSHEGWEHLRQNERLEGDRDNVLNCIGRILARGTVRSDTKGITPQWVYAWKWGVRVGKRTGSVITAFPGRGGVAKNWAHCAGR